MTMIIITGDNRNGTVATTMVTAIAIGIGVADATRPPFMHRPSIPKRHTHGPFWATAPGRLWTRVGVMARARDIAEEAEAVITL